MFYLNQFELHLQEALLKKGFKLFCQNQVKELDKNAHYLVKQQHLHVDIKNNQLKKYRCACGTDHYCEHLAAVLFYVQQSKLPWPEDFQQIPKNQKPTKPALQQFDALQQIIFKSSLVGFAAKENNKKSGQLLPLLQLLKSNLKGFKTRVPLNQDQIDELCRVIKQATQLIRVNADTELSLEWALATHLFFQHLRQFRFAGDEINLRQIKADTEKQLLNYLQSGLKGKQKQIWYKALLWSLQSNMLIKSRGFYFLGLPYLVHCNKAEELMTLDVLLKKRKYLKTYDEDFNALIVLKHLWHFKMYGTPKKWLFDSQTFEPEFYMALCEYYFLKKLTDKGFELLDDCLQFLQQQQKSLLRMFSQYAINKSEQYANRQKNHEYLAFSVVHNIHFNPEELNRLVNLWPKKEIDLHINALLLKISRHNQSDSKEKSIALLSLLNDHTRLVNLLSKENNQFKLFHQCVMQQPDLLSGKIMADYARQLGQSLHHAVSFARQEALLESCMPLLKALTGEQFNALLNHLYVQTGYESPLGRLLGTIAEKCLAEKTKTGFNKFQ